MRRQLVRSSKTQDCTPLPQLHRHANLPSHLGHFSIAGRDYTVDLETKKIQPGSTDERGDTVVAMEIKDSEGAVQYRRTFPYIEAKEDYFESWSVSAFLLTGTNGTGLLVSYEVYSEPSAPEEEPTGWFQVFGVVNGKFIPFGAPLEVRGGLLDEYADGHTYKPHAPWARRQMPSNSKPGPAIAV